MESFGLQISLDEPLILGDLLNPQDPTTQLILYLFSMDSPLHLHLTNTNLKTAHSHQYLAAFDTVFREIVGVHQNNQINNSTKYFLFRASYLTRAEIDPWIMKTNRQVQLPSYTDVYETLEKAMYVAW